MSLIATLDVALRGQTGDLDNKLRRAELGVKAYASAVEQAGAKIDAALGAMTGGLSKLIGFGTYFTDSFGKAWDEFKRMISSGGEGIAALAKAADRFGITTQMLGGLEHAAALVGVPFDELVGMLGKFQRHLGDAANGGGPLVATLQQIGVRIEDVKDKNLYEAFLLVTDGFKKFGNEADKTRIATELFSKTGINMKPVLKLGSDAIREMTEEAMRLGIAVGTDQADAVRAGQRALREYEEALKGIGRSLAVVVAPLLESTNKAWARAAKVVAEFTADNVPLLTEFSHTLISLKDAAIEMAGALADKVGGAVAGLVGRLTGAVDGDAFGAFRDAMLKGFYAVQFAAQNWRSVLELALDATNLAFQVFARKGEQALYQMAYVVVYTMNEWQRHLGITDNMLVYFGQNIGRVLVLMAKISGAVIGIDVELLLKQLKVVGQAAADQIGHAATPLETQLQIKIGELEEALDNENDLKQRIRDRWGKLSDDMADFIDKKMEAFGLQFNAPDLFDRVKIGWGMKLGKRVIPLDAAPEAGAALAAGQAMKAGALERGSAAAFSVIYGTQSAQDKALATANQQLSTQKLMQKLLEKLERNMRDPVVLRRARL